MGLAVPSLRRSGEETTSRLIAFLQMAIARPFSRVSTTAWSVSITGATASKAALVSGPYPVGQMLKSGG